MRVIYDFYLFQLEWTFIFCCENMNVFECDVLVRVLWVLGYIRNLYYLILLKSEKFCIQRSIWFQEFQLCFISPSVFSMFSFFFFYHIMHDLCVHTHAHGLWIEVVERWVCSEFHEGFESALEDNWWIKHLWIDYLRKSMPLHKMFESRFLFLSLLCQSFTCGLLVGEMLNHFNS